MFISKDLFKWQSKDRLKKSYDIYFQQFKSPTIKQSVTSPINGNKSRNQERDNGYYRLIIGDKKKMAETDAMNKYLNVISKVIVMPIV